MRKEVTLKSMTTVIYYLYNEKGSNSKKYDNFNKL